jgi:hypothetical protein
MGEPAVNWPEFTPDCKPCAMRAFWLETAGEVWVIGCSYFTAPGNEARQMCFLW